MSMSPSTEVFVPPPEYASQRDFNWPVSVAPDTSSATDEELVSAESHPSTPPSQQAAPLPMEREESFQGINARLSRRYTSLPSRNSITFPHQPMPISYLTPPSAPAAPHSPNYRREKLLSQSTVGHGQTNHVSLSRKTIPHKRFLLSRASASITGSFVVNPYLHIPAALLSPLPDRRAKPRKNLKLEVENGGIDVGIFLVGFPDDDEDARPQTSLSLKLRGEMKNTFPLVAKIVSLPIKRVHRG